MFVKKGDKVRVIAGKDKGTEAVVLTALPKVKQKLSLKVLTSLKNTNVQLTSFLKVVSLRKKQLSTYLTFKFLDKNGVAGRVGYKFVDGKKVRYNKKSGEVLD